ncbi:hypothetical protein HAX54_050763 [Datura stramonium]|uniref:Uncharacterized protein n=1 Tax=Datura stramonium TaxID=4076 RepID=A0ABS8WRG6_DATST|nr:hypothetical protein [Datura stramonium]
MRNADEPPALITGLTSDKKINPDRGVLAIADVSRQFTPYSGASPGDSLIDFEPPGVVDRFGDPLVVREMMLFILHYVALPARGRRLTLLHWRSAGVAPVMPCPCIP